MIASLVLFSALLDPQDKPSNPQYGPPSVEEPKPVTERLPNRKGNVLILMYHRIEQEEKNMVRSYENFEADLNRLYAMGYRPVTLDEYVNNRMPLPRGASPVILTFDDSWQSQFSMKSDGSIDPKSAVGIWKKFADKNPDFPVKGTFFILPNGPFGQKKFAKRKVELLLEWGSEIGSHTMTHGNLSKMSDGEVMKELAGSYDYIASLGIKARSIATPYGIAPKNRSLLNKFELNGKRYGYDNICLAGSSPAPSPVSGKMDRLRIPRVQAYDGTLGISYWLNRVSSGKVQPYVQP
ncbi:MAG: polysaccharide deacetylase family protein [Armatimonadetes bacterium]|nr:polysaccharide deacetylase family protein [Armatimonadota bacterium]